TQIGQVYRHELEAIAAGKVSTVCQGFVALLADGRGAIVDPPAGGVAISEVAGLAAELAAKIPLAQRGAAGGVGTLDSQMILEQRARMSIPTTFTEVDGSPFTLTSSWTKVATTTSATRGLRIAPLPTAVVFDV